MNYLDYTKGLESASDPNDVVSIMLGHHKDHYSTFVTVIDGLESQIQIDYSVDSLTFAGEQLRELLGSRYVGDLVTGKTELRANNNSQFPFLQFQLKDLEKNDALMFRDCTIYTLIMKELLDRQSIPNVLIFQPSRLHPFLFIGNRDEESLIQYGVSAVGRPGVIQINSKNLSAKEFTDKDTYLYEQYLDLNLFTPFEKERLLSLIDPKLSHFSAQIDEKLLRFTDLFKLVSYLRAYRKYEFKTQELLPYLSLELMQATGGQGIPPQSMYALFGLPGRKVSEVINRLKL